LLVEFTDVFKCIQMLKIAVPSKKIVLPTEKLQKAASILAEKKINLLKIIKI